MADHILGHTKKCVKTGNGSFYDSGGPAPTSNGPGVGYRSGERDYFIIRRNDLNDPVGTGSYTHIEFVIEEWDVHDYTLVPDHYDFIDVWTSNTGYPNSWTFHARLGGAVHNAANMPSSTDTFGIGAAAVKFCFKSQNQQIFNKTGWKLSFSEATSLGSATDLNATADTATYTGSQALLDIKENCQDNIYTFATGTLFSGRHGSGDDEVDYFTLKANEIISDPGSENWSYLAPEQVSHNITTLNNVFVQSGYNKNAHPITDNVPGQVPFSFLSPMRLRLSSEPPMVTITEVTGNEILQRF